MPIVENWMRSRREKNVWFFRGADIEARLESERKIWRGRIIDKEFNKLNSEFTDDNFKDARKRLVKRMKAINGRIKLRPEVV